MGNNAESRAPDSVSVVIAAYNCADYIAQTLRSVLAQDPAPLEVIVVDDGSTDRTREVAASFPSDRVILLSRSNSGGPSAPRNAGIERARGRYIAFIDADDVMLPGKLAGALRLFEREPALGFVFGDFVKFDAVRGEHPGTFLEGYRHFAALRKRKAGDAGFVIAAGDAYDCLLSENFVGTSGVVVPKEVLRRVGVFDETLKAGEDFDLWLRIASAYDIGFVDAVGHRYRVRGDGIMGGGDGKTLPDAIRVIRKQQERSLPAATRRKLRGNLAHHLWELGYHHQLRGESALARRFYALSLREGLFRLPCKGILTTLLPARAVSALKRLIG
jgi:glycosyltransferase involved in cell wall biosynthesis